MRLKSQRSGISHQLYPLGTESRRRATIVPQDTIRLRQRVNVNLVHRAGRTNPTPRATHAASGLPIMVHLNGFAGGRVKEAMKASMRAFRSCWEVKLARRSSLRTRMENQISIWFSQDACLGVK